MVAIAGGRELPCRLRWHAIALPHESGRCGDVARQATWHAVDACRSTGMFRIGRGLADAVCNSGRAQPEATR